MTKIKTILMTKIITMGLNEKNADVSKQYLKIDKQGIFNIFRIYQIYLI